MSIDTVFPAGVVDSSVRTYHCGTAGPSSELTWQGQGRSWKNDNIQYCSPTHVYLSLHSHMSRSRIASEGAMIASK